jgi:predicted Rossmann fold nucleotide-binding protein DprA/Smf involved in DNA uptake
LSAIIQKIVSGGQTGVDRAALDVALELGIPCGGWCPRGRQAVDGVIPEKYPLQETETRNYDERTRLNVLDSDGTLILNTGALSGGTAYTAEVARANDKPLLVIPMDETSGPGDVIEWIAQDNVRVLNVAGPREQGHPGIHDLAAGFLRKVFQELLQT